MELFNSKQNFIYLSDLAATVGAVLDDAFAGRKFWVVAEIAGVHESKGHCYLSLIEKEEGSVDLVAEMRGVIWRNYYGFIAEKFRNVTGENLKAGIKILFCATVRFHIRYGLSLTVEDIEPGYTIGQMLLDRMRVIERLKQEGVYDKNKSLEFPLVPQRLAIISAENSRGYEDFINKLENNPYGYRFIPTLYPSAVQGEKAAEEICAQLKTIGKCKRQYDVVIIVRGGGGISDLNCYNNYLLAKAVATCPLPVITGIGHTVNISIVDEVAHACRITPTDVADFLIETVSDFETSVDSLFTGIASISQNITSDNRHEIEAALQNLVHYSTVFLKEKRYEMNSFVERFSFSLTHLHQALGLGLNEQERKIAILDPKEVLARGYSITRSNGKILKNPEDALTDDLLESHLSRGKISSKVV
ncbi:MAG: exodeoxyribonuclease VII large subunit [Bacteroidetes bacterium]|nr:exodeoxyribonuclease VII large subunit [Bacteroidota bacterium]